MENNLFADITESKGRLAKYTANGRSQHAAAPNNSEDDVINPSNLAKENSNYIFEAKYSVSISNLEKRVENSLLKSPFVVFELCTMRTSDGEAHSVWKRYKELYAWYYDLLSELEEIEYNRAVAFPTYSESWLGGSAKADVNSDFVQRRRADLQNFFHSLFCQYPRLFDHPKVVQLLELQRFSPESKSSSIYSKPESYYDVYAAATAPPPLLAPSAVPSFQPQLTSKTAEAYQRVAPPGRIGSGGMSIVNFVSTPNSTAPNRPAYQQQQQQQKKPVISSTSSITANAAPLEWAV